MRNWYIFMLMYVNRMKVRNKKAEDDVEMKTINNNVRYSDDEMILIMFNAC